MESIKKICDRRGIRIIEDACHALGGEYRTVDGQWHSVGSCQHSDMAVFSMHPVKNIAMGEGGMVTTNDDQLCQTLRRLRNHGMIREPNDFQHPEAGLDAAGEPNPWYYEMQQLGYNYRAISLPCNLTRFEDKLTPTPLGFFSIFLKHIFSFLSYVANFCPDWRRPQRPSDGMWP